MAAQVTGYNKMTVDLWTLDLTGQSLGTTSPLTLPLSRHFLPLAEWGCYEDTAQMVPRRIILLVNCHVLSKPTESGLLYQGACLFQVSSKSSQETDDRKKRNKDS